MVEPLTGAVLVPAEFALYADWSSFTDDPIFQDPEVAAAFGYEDVLVPPGALSVLGALSDTERVERIAPCTLRSWSATGVISAGTRLTVELEWPASGPGVVTRFLDEGGRVVAREEFAMAGPGIDSGRPDQRCAAAFETGLVDDTRLRALALALNLLAEERVAWRHLPDDLLRLVGRFVLPALISSRATLVHGAEAARRIARIDVSGTDPHETSSLAAGHRWVAVPETDSFSIEFADGRQVAQVSIVVSDRTDERR